MKPRPSFPARLALPDKQAQHAVKARTSAMSRASVAAGSLPAAVNQQPVSSGLPSAPRAAESSAARRNMAQKLVALGLSDHHVAAALELVERHRFVDSALQAQAYEDTSLPIGLGQTISKPGVVARMIELLRNGREGKLGRVLEIGTGCGYQAAVLSGLASEVYSIERLRGLHDKARANLRHLRLANVHLLLGDGMAGFAKGAPYAGVIAAACGEVVPVAWTDQLALGGRLVAPVARGHGASGQQALVVIDKSSSGLRQSVFDAVHFVPLKSGVA